MTVDLLRVEANERVDLLDFQQLANTTMEDALRVQGNSFLTNPLSSARSWILDGFAITGNPLNKQLTVTKGRAVLARRVGGTVKFGIITTEGDASKIIDMAAMAVATYNVYIRFEYVDGDNSSRIFWNAAGTGSEFAQTMSTKLKASWSLRVETGSPGAEWLQIGTANNAILGLTLVDQRPFYFEGVPSTTYSSGWSSDGGGTANDRNANRATYGVKDLQTFTAATRQCLEDIKGRGLRRWWDRDIGGMNIGFDAAPVEDRLAIGDADMYLQWDSTYPELRMGAGGDSLVYDRSGNHWQFKIANVEEMRLGNDGLAIANGLYVGDATGVPTDNNILAEGTITANGGMTSTGSASHTSGGVFTGFAGGGSGLQVFAGATVGWSTGIVSTGAGTGPGGYFVGGILAGESGHGAIGIGGIAGGVGFWGQGSSGAIGVEGVYGVGSILGGPGVKGVGKGSYPGITGEGGAVGGSQGVYGQGGIGGGIGVKGYATGGLLPGVLGDGNQTGAGVEGQGGLASGPGGFFVGRGVGSFGVEGYSLNGTGVYGRGGNYGGNFYGLNPGAIGVRCEGFGSGDGITGFGGNSSGKGVYGEGGTPNGPGVWGLGKGTGVGVRGEHLSGGISVIGTGTLGGVGVYANHTGSGPALQTRALGTGWGGWIEGVADPRGVNGRAAFHIEPQINVSATPHPKSGQLVDGDIWVNASGIYIKINGLYYSLDKTAIVVIP